MITYNDIKAKQAEIRKAQKAYVQKLRDVAKWLVDAYIKSLQLPKEQWSDSEGNQRPYVYIKCDGFECRPEDLKIDLCTGAYFELCTVVDDDPREAKGEKVSVSVNSADNGEIEIIVRGYENKTFSAVDSDEKINNICEFIKDSILMSMNDVSFGGKSSEAFKLWD